VRVAWDDRFLPAPRSPHRIPMPRRLDPEAAIGHLDRLYAAARALSGDPHLAEDLVQDTYAAVLSRPRWLSGSDELGYLLRALRNRWRDELRIRARRPQPASLDDESTDLPRAVTPAPDAVLDGKAVLDVLHQLPSPYRETLVAIDVVGLSYAECSKALGVPAGTVMSRLHRGRAKVAERLRALELAPAS
jgi:RNA polymerase sigma-70 factor, ECF subfamily